MAKYQYEGDKGRVFDIPNSEKIAGEIAAYIYRTCCERCKLKVKKIDILGGHCSHKGDIPVKGKKCAARK